MSADDLFVGCPMTADRWIRVDRYTRFVPDEPKKYDGTVAVRLSHIVRVEFDGLSGEDSGGVTTCTPSGWVDTIYTTAFEAQKVLLELEKP